MSLTERQKNDFAALIEAAKADALILVMAKHKETGESTPIVCAQAKRPDGGSTLYPLAVLAGEWVQYEPPGGMTHVKNTGESRGN